MIEEYKEYISILDSNIPDYIYEVFYSLLIIGVVMILVTKGFRRGWRCLSGWILAEYIFLIFCSTILFRSENEIRTYHFKPFWSYELCFRNGGFFLAPEIGLNILVFIPVGLLLGVCCKSVNWWKAMLFGGGISMMIEGIQLITKRGLSEFDDVFNNTLGCMVGYGIYCLADKTGKMIKAKTR